MAVVCVMGYSVAEGVHAFFVQHMPTFQKGHDKNEDLLAET